MCSHKNSSKRLLIKKISIFLVAFSLMLSTRVAVASDNEATYIREAVPKKLAYVVSDIRIPFWDIMWRGVKSTSESLGYEVVLYSADNSAKQELENTVSVLRQNITGIIVSPTNSSACATILKLAKGADTPVVISDIGTDSGDYASYISSNNRSGAYKIGQVLAAQMAQRGWTQGRVGIIAIPQKRLNGQARTSGFMQAMNEAGIKSADIKQQSTFSDQETYDFSKVLIAENRDLRAIWLQGSDRYSAALRAINEAGKKDEILLATFDAEPEFIDLIPQGILVGSAMQQPYLMGKEAVIAMDRYLNKQLVEKNKQLPVLAVSTDNIASKLHITCFRKHIFG
jgi:ribose transport system substrate-binding protein